jgi:hypothetical protein
MLDRFGMFVPVLGIMYECSDVHSAGIPFQPSFEFAMPSFVNNAFGFPISTKDLNSIWSRLLGHVVLL